MSDAPVPSRWRVLLTPRWIGWHLFAVAAVAGMAWLGDWQLHRALAGNTLSWAYTFEWPLFAIFGVFFWVKTVRDELRTAAGRRCGRRRPGRRRGPGWRGGRRRAGWRPGGGRAGRVQRLPGQAAPGGEKPRPVARPALAVPPGAAGRDG